MKILLIISLCIFTLVGCGKAEITSSCTLNGGGDVQCTFKNIGKAKGGTCEYMALVPKEGADASYFLLAEDTRIIEALKQLKNALSTKSFKVEDQLPSEVLRFLDTKNKMYGDGEICSGIIDVGDIRQVTAFIQFHNRPPTKICANDTGGWTNGCGFITVQKVEIVSLLNAKLNE